MRLLESNNENQSLNSHNICYLYAYCFFSALKLLSIMVYVDGVAETLTTTGGIGLLVEALKKSADLLPNSVSEDALEGIIGAIKMLGKVSGKAADHAGSVVKWGGVPVRYYSMVQFLNNAFCCK